MSKWAKKIVLHAVIGFVVGAAVGLLIAWLASLPSDGSRLMEFSPVTKKVGFAGAIALQILVSGLLGCVSVSGMLLYEIEKWSLALATVVHFLAIMAFFTLASFSMGWFAGNVAYFFIAVACNAVGFAVIWVIMYLLWKKEVRKMNEDLREYKKETDGERDDEKK